jgi:hypothetical protein
MVSRPIPSSEISPANEMGVPDALTKAKIAAAATLPTQVLTRCDITGGSG